MLAFPADVKEAGKRDRHLIGHTFYLPLPPLPTQYIYANRLKKNRDSDSEKYEISPDKYACLECSDNSKTIPWS